MGLRPPPFVPKFPCGTWRKQGSNGQLDVRWCPAVLRTAVGDGIEQKTQGLVHYPATVAAKVPGSGMIEGYGPASDNIKTRDDDENVLPSVTEGGIGVRGSAGKKPFPVLALEVDPPHVAEGPEVILHVGASSDGALARNRFGFLLSGSRHREG